MGTKVHRWEGVPRGTIGRRRLLRGGAIGAAGLASYAVVGCGDDDDDEPGAATTPAGTAAGSQTAAATATTASAPMGKLVIDLTAGGGTLQAFNPIMWTAGTQAPYRDAIADSLVNVDKDGDKFKYYGQLAKSWERTPDGLTVTFKMNEAAKFHDGSPVRAEDVKFSLEFVKDERARHARKSEWTRVLKTVETPDEHTAVVQLNEPYPLLTSFNFMFPILSKAAFDKAGFDGFEQSPVCAGPFRWVNGVKSERANLVAMEGHYRKTPFIKELQIKATPEESTRLAQLETGETDIAYISPTNKQTVIGFGGKVANTNDDISFWLVVMDPYVGKTDTPVNDKRVREALSKAINRADITAKLFAGAAKPAGSWANPAIPGFASDLKPDPFDLADAKRLLDAAGYGSGFAIDYFTAAPTPEYANVIAADWKKIGIDATIKPLDAGASLAQINAKKTPGVYIQGTGSNYIDPAQWGLFTFSDGSFSYMKDTALDAKMRVISSGVKDEDRYAAWTDLQRMVADLRINTPLWTTSTHFGLSKRVREWDPIPGIGYIQRMEFARAAT